MNHSETSLNNTDARIAQYRAAEKRWTYIAWCFILLFAAGLVMCLLGNPPHLGTIAAVAAAIFLIYFRLNQLSKKIRETLDDVVRGVLEKEFEHLTIYGSAGCIDASLVRHTDMSLPAYHKMQGSDLIKARIRGVDFAWSNLQLILVGPTETGGSRKTRTSVFSGCWFSLRTDLQFPAKLTVSTADHKPFAGKQVAMQSGNAAFDNRFFLRSETPEQAAAMVTPALMALAETMADRHGAVHLHLDPNGLIHLAIPTDTPRFSRDTGSSAILAARFEEDAAFLTDQLGAILDALTPQQDA